MIEQVLSNWICWFMLVVAWVAYWQIFTLFVHRNQVIDNDDTFAEQIEKKQFMPSVLVSALPLMGLLGTIVGLQGSFTGMMTQGVDSQVVSAGIADALLTTQMGLVLAIPGWLALAMVKGAVARAWQLRAEHQHG